MSRSQKLSAALAAGAAILAVGGVALAQTRPFSFRTVEYMPRDQREPVAQGYVASHFSPGMPMGEAVATARAAGTYCHPMRADGEVDCVANSFQRHPGDLLRDVSWTLHLQPGPDGRLIQASVVRTVS